MPFKVSATVTCLRSSIVIKNKQNKKKAFLNINPSGEPEKALKQPIFVRWNFSQEKAKRSAEALAAKIVLQSTSAEVWSVWKIKLFRKVQDLTLRLCYYTLSVGAQSLSRARLLPAARIRPRLTQCSHATWETLQGKKSRHPSDFWKQLPSRISQIYFYLLINNFRWQSQP